MTRWWPGEEPRRPTLSDKLADWNVLPLVNGEEFIRGHDVLDLGPEYGLDAIMFAHLARRYVIVDNAEDVLDWMHDLAADARLISGNVEIVKMDARFLEFDNEFDLVLDFGSIDNTGNNETTYSGVIKALRHHGLLITTYANRNILTNEFSDDNSEQRVHPEALASFLRAEGMWVRNRYREDQARAVMIAQKGWEPYSGCTWYTSGVCGCPGRPASL